jgi:hypothetical protein
LHLHCSLSSLLFFFQPPLFVKHNLEISKKVRNLWNQRAMSNFPELSFNSILGKQPFFNGKRGACLLSRDPVIIIRPRILRMALDRKIACVNLTTGSIGMSPATLSGVEGSISFCAAFFSPVLFDLWERFGYFASYPSQSRDNEELAWIIVK